MKSDILVRQVRCDRTPGDDAYAAGHSAFCLAYVQRGSFAYHARGRIFEMVRGAAAIGHAGIEYTCTHDDSRGDDCLIFEFPDNAVELLGGYGALRNVDALPPIAEVAVFGELAQAVMDRQSDLALDEVGCLLLRAAIRASGDDAPAVRDVSPIQRSRVIDASHWLDAHSSDDISLGDAAAYAGISPYHFLRQFVRVVGVTPHQFIIRSRLRRAAYLLCTNELSVTDVAAAVGFFGPLEFHTVVPARRRHLTPSVSARSARRPQFFPRTVRCDSP